MGLEPELRAMRKLQRMMTPTLEDRPRKRKGVKRGSRGKMGRQRRKRRRGKLTATCQSLRGQGRMRIQIPNHQSVGERVIREGRRRRLLLPKKKAQRLKPCPLFYRFVNSGG